MKAQHQHTETWALSIRKVHIFETNNSRLGRDLNNERRLERDRHPEGTLSRLHMEHYEMHSLPYTARAWPSGRPLYM